MNVFFYGLFMDVSLLAEKGISPGTTATGYVEGFALRIGQRATLIPAAGERAYGVMMQISSHDAHALYGESSVADYAPEQVVVKVAEGKTVAATCYNLPVDKVAGTNKAYAEALWKLAEQLGLPEHYLAKIRLAGG